MVNSIYTPITSFLSWELIFGGQPLSQSQQFALAQEYAYLDELTILPTEDKATRAIASYVGNGLNYAISRLNGRLNREYIAVRDIEQYDAVNPDLSRFPLVKVYRTVETFKSRHERNVTAVLAYCLTFPNQNELPAALSWVSATTNLMLRQYALKSQNCPVSLKMEDEWRAEYRIMVNEVSSPVYAFLRFNFSFVEQLSYIDI